MNKIFASFLVVAALSSLLLAQNPHKKNATVVIARKSFRNQVGPIPTTTLFTPASNGDFRVSVYLESGTITAPFPNNQIWVNAIWTDDFAQQCIAEGGFLSSGKYTQGSTVIHGIANKPIVINGGGPGACATTPDTIDQYNAFVTLEKLP